jgi:hypothetical protein
MIFKDLLGNIMEHAAVVALAESVGQGSSEVRRLCTSAKRIPDCRQAVFFPVAVGNTDSSRRHRLLAGCGRRNEAYGSVKISALIRVGLQTAEEASPSMKNDLHRTAA